MPLTVLEVELLAALGKTRQALRQIQARPLADAAGPLAGYAAMTADLLPRVELAMGFVLRGEHEWAADALVRLVESAEGDVLIEFVYAQGRTANISLPSALARRLVGVNLGDRS